MTLPPGLAAVIDAAVEQAGGTADDAADLAETWQRLGETTERKAGGLRTAARLQRCACRDGGDPEGSCCGRCFGRLAS